MGQTADQLINESLNDGAFAPIEQENVMQQQYTASFESDDDDTNPDTRAAREEIERTRERMSETIEAISERLDPHALTQQAKDAVRDATIGKVESAAKSAGITARGAFNMAGESLNGVADKVKETIGSIGGHGGASAPPNGTIQGDSLERAVHTGGAGRLVRSALLKTGPRLRGMADQAQSGFRRELAKKPLVVGVVLVGLGALIGFAIPETEPENRLLGRMGSRLVTGERVMTGDQAGRLTV